MNVVGDAPHRQRVKAALAGAPVPQRGVLQQVPVEQLPQGTEHLGEVHEPTFVGHWSAKSEPPEEIGRLPGFER